MSNLPVVYRGMLESDREFIYSSWLRSFKKGTMVRNINHVIYFANHHRLIDDLLSRSEIVVCTSPEDANIIYGYIVYQKIEQQLCVHYVYVKNLYRKLGIASGLLSETKHDFNIAGCYTHQTLPAIAKEERFNLVYHPYLLINYK